MFALVTVVACAPPPWDSQGIPADPDAEADPGPAITLLWPEVGAQVVGCTRMVAFVENFDLIPSTDPVSANVQGQGHWHVYAGSSYSYCDEPYCVVELDPAYVAEGVQELRAALQQNDHSDVLDTAGAPVEARVSVDVQQGECTL